MYWWFHIVLEISNFIRRPLNINLTFSGIGLAGVYVLIFHLILVNENVSITIDIYWDTLWCDYQVHIGDYHIATVYYHTLWSCAKKDNSFFLYVGIHSNLSSTHLDQFMGNPSIGAIPEELHKERYISLKFSKLLETATS